jgi:hypothetical protein
VSRLPREGKESRHENKNHDASFIRGAHNPDRFLPDFANAQADFYRGKTVTIIHGRSAGGSGEMRARAGRDQKGRDCVLRIGLETQEAAITK